MPASSGLMGILPSHAPTVAQLRPGVVEVHDEGDKETFFVSSGFAFVHKDRTDLCAVEAVKVRSCATVMRMRSRRTLYMYTAGLTETLSYPLLVRAA